MPGAASRAARWAALDAASSAPAVSQHTAEEHPDIVTETESEDGEGLGGLFTE